MDEAWLSWHRINEISAGKKIILFGRGYQVSKTCPYLSGRVSCIVDNSPYEWEQVRECGLVVRNPVLLDDLNWDEHFVIITTAHFTEVSEQLCSLGMIPGRHFCISPVLENYYAQVEVNQHEATLYLTCSDQYLKGEQERGGGLYRFDIPSCTLTKLIDGTCHGIVEGEGCFYLIDDQIGGIRLLDSEFVPLGHWDLPVGCRPHGIAYCPKRRWLFVALSEFDVIAILDAQTMDAGYRPLYEIELSGKRRRMGTSQHHINDLLVFEDSLYASMFSFSGNWKIGIFDGGILEFDISTRELFMPVVTGLWMPHTPTIIESKLWYTDSMRGKVYCGTEELLIEFNGFVRGIAYDGRFHYVGQSLHRYPDRLRKITHNVSLDTGVFMVDKESYMTKFFPTPRLTDINTILIPSVEKTYG